jgi:hypothetical protein
MKSTGIKIKEVTQEFVAAHEYGSYNRSIWKQTVKDYAKYKDVKWYISEADSETGYTEFYCQYTIEEGLRFLGKVSFSSSITNRPFKRAFIVFPIINWDTHELSDVGEIFTKGFGDDEKSGIVNSRQGRKWLVKNICSLGIAVSNSL